MTDFPWTKEAVETLTQHYADGMSCSLIASHLGGGVTRNAVIGKLHRLGLSRSPDAARVVWPRAHKPTHPECVTPKRKPARRPPPVVFGKVVSTGPKPPTPPTPAPEPATIKPLHLTLMQLQEGHCRFPYGDAVPYTFCGCQTQLADSYCAPHARLVRNPTDKRVNVSTKGLRYRPRGTAVDPDHDEEQPLDFSEAAA